MSFIIRNQRNNWAYILILVLLTLIVGGWMIYYAYETIEEINRLSSSSVLQYK